MRKVKPVSPVRVCGIRPTSQVGVNPKDKVGALKVPLDVIPPTAEIFLALGMMVGGRKYGEFNYRVEPIKARGYLAAAKRHIKAVEDGQDFDALEGIHHLCFAMSTCAIYLDALVQGTLIDDRAVAGRSGEMIDLFSKVLANGAKPEELKAALETIVNAKRNTKDDMVRIPASGSVTGRFSGKAYITELPRKRRYKAFPGVLETGNIITDPELKISKSPTKKPSRNTKKGQ